MRAWATWAMAAVALLGAAVCAAAPAFPALSGRVVDQADILPAAARAELDEMLAAHERAGSNQVVVVTVDSLQGYAIEDFGYQLGRYWGIGQAARNNGVLLLVAPKEREVRIEVGYGLEGTLTDALAHNIIRGVILPRFRAGDMPGGIVAGARAVLQVIDGAYQPLPEKRGDGQDPAGSFMSLFIFLTIAGEMLARLLRARRVSAGLLGGGAVLIGWLVLGSLLLGLVMGVLVAVFHLMLGAGGGPGSGLPGIGRGGSYPGGRRGGGFGGGFRGGGGSFGGGGASGRW
ncbi:MAG: TPM domain-containing protein [Gammaproteobacteria bacterium]|nr:TPM domain-containing protein [Gammaproteobacteria bacterium]